MPTEDARFDAIDRRFDSFEKILLGGFGRIEQRLDSFEHNFERLQHDFKEMRADFGSRIELMANYVRLTDQGYFSMTNRMSDLESRIANLEKTHQAR